jgi:hypothetical protein
MTKAETPAAMPPIAPGLNLYSNAGQPGGKSDECDYFHSRRETPRGRRERGINSSAVNDRCTSVFKMHRQSTAYCLRGLSKDRVIDAEGLTRKRSIRNPHGVISWVQLAVLVQNLLRRESGPGSIEGHRRSAVELDHVKTTGWSDHTVKLDMSPYRNNSIRNENDLGNRKAPSYPITLGYHRFTLKKLRVAHLKYKIRVCATQGRRTAESTLVSARIQRSRHRTRTLTVQYYRHNSQGCSGWCSTQMTSNENNWRCPAA